VHFLVIDTRFQVPIFVFLELDPGESATGLGLPVHGVTLELAPDRSGRSPPGAGAGVPPTATIGQDPWALSRFVEFPSDGHVRAAGFSPIEPRYVGTSWETYLTAFRPEGERPGRHPAIHKNPVVAAGQPARAGARPEGV